VLDKEEKSEGLGLLTDLIIIMTLIDVIRLKDAGVRTFKEYIKKCNKFCVTIWLLISALLLISGNRNEMLLVLLPGIVAYTVCIHPIKSRHIIIALFIGVFLMVASGTTRHDGFGISGGVYNVMTLTVDFSNLGYDCDYLIQYTDKFGSTNFKGMSMVLLSGIPYIGHLVVDFLGLEGVVTTPDLTTESVGSESGLGTSIIGDMYYTSGMVWILVYMFLFGYIMSRLYYSNKNVSIYLLFVYTYLVANAVYYMRSSWYFPITRLEYVCIIIFIGRLVFRNNKQKIVQS
jgi:oligosaccharide repeat unit polymerase